MTLLGEKAVSREEIYKMSLKFLIVSDRKEIQNRMRHVKRIKEKTGRVPDDQN